MENQALETPTFLRRAHGGTRATARTKARYNRVAPVYDLMQRLMDRGAIGKGRPCLWSHVRGNQLLEVGVGTGKNMDYYPQGADITAIDLSEGMLERARRKAEGLGLEVDLRLMDVQHLDLPSGSFDGAVATCVFCSVPDAVAGLRELKRVTRPGGDIWLLEHVRIDRPVIGTLMDLLNPIMVRMMGANINRRTVENVRRSGLQVVSVEHVGGELVKLIHARA